MVLGVLTKTLQTSFWEKEKHNNNNNNNDNNNNNNNNGVAHRAIEVGLKFYVLLLGRVLESGS